MHILKILSLSFFLIYSTSCAFITPTPGLMGQMRDLNAEVLMLYAGCSTGTNYTPHKENCNLPLLETKVADLLELSKEFIKADYTQPQGYDFHLATSMIYFRIAERTADDYSLAERISRQFFEIQKAYDGQSLDEARFYWPYFTAANSSFQYWNSCWALDEVRKKDDLLPALTEGAALIDRVKGVRWVRLRQSLQILESIIKYINDGNGVLRSACAEIFRSNRSGLACIRI